MLTALGRFNDSQELLKDLRVHCRRFGDFETLCRVGNTYKKLADEAWDTDTQSDESLLGSNHPSQQWFYSAYECYWEAYDFSQDYFPGINAAYLASLLGKKDKSVEIAQSVARICERINLGELAGDEAYWVLCTEGEATLLAGDIDGSVTFFKQALSRLSPNKKGLAEITLTSLRRSSRILGDGKLAKVISLFEKFLK